MSSVFNTTTLVDDRVLVEGTEVGETTVLDSRQWENIKGAAAVEDSNKEFDQTVKDFFAPILEKEAELGRKHAESFDPELYIVQTEAVEGVEEVHQEIVRLTNDTVILRMIEGGNTSRLRWVSGDIVVVAKN